MNEADARRVLLLRAFESGPTASWSEADAAWASGEAQRQVGERASAEQFVVARAALGSVRLAERDAAVAGLLQASGGHAAWGWVVVLLGGVIGLASDAIGAGQRINILAPPLLGLLLWNLAVYLVLAMAALRPGGAAAGVGMGPLRRALSRAAARVAGWLGQRTEPGSSPAWARFALAWASASTPLQAARLAAVLHAAAAALAVGALLSLYLRGLAFEYLAGWTSTFLSAPAVHGLLATVLGPASQLSGIPLPGVAELAALRFSAGPGENAARWIHLYALTLGAAVVLPRLLLAAFAAWRARSLARQFPLPLSDAYFLRLQRAQSGERVAVQVWPYNYQLPEALRPALASWLDRRFGPGVVVSLAANVPLGGEDELNLATVPSDGLLVALLSLTATPERETHGVFLRQLAAQVQAARLVVVIDESGFRQRLSGADAESRLGQRRAAWQRLLDESGQTALFVDLRQPERVQ